jgi:hypothetical protein
LISSPVQIKLDTLYVTVSTISLTTNPTKEVLQAVLV